MVWELGLHPLLELMNDEERQFGDKRIKNIEDIPNNIYVQYRKNSLIEQPIKKIIYSVINHEIHQ